MIDSDYEQQSRRASRPRYRPTGEPTKRLSVEVSPETHAAIARIAAENVVSQGVVVDFALTLLQRREAKRLSKAEAPND